MLITKNRIAKDREINFWSDINGVLVEFESYYSREYYNLLSMMKSCMTIDDVQQSMALGKLTPSSRAKVEAVIDMFLEDNANVLIEDTAQWTFDKLKEQVPDFDFTQVSAKEWADDLKKTFKEQMLDQQEKVIVEASEDLRNQAYYDNIPDRRLAELINYGSALDVKSVKAGVNYYNNQLNNGVGKVRALKATKRYFNNKYVRRGEILGLDNLLQTYMMVEFQSVGIGLQQGIFNHIVKQWQSCEDSRVCPVCKRVNGKVIEYDDDFYLSNGTVTSGIDGAHSLCRCAVLYIEKELIDEGIFNPNFGF